MNNHWSNKISLHDVLAVANLTGYKTTPDVHTKADLILAVACDLIKHPRSTLGTGADRISHFLRAVRAGCGRS